MLKKSLCIFFALLLCLSGASAAVADRTYSSEFIGTDLARGRTPLCALRDAYGFLWVGTHSGLACYDGNGQSVYEPVGGVLRSTEGMSVNSLFELGDDILFGGTPGLCVFSRKDNTSRPFPLRTKYGVPVSSPVQKIIDAADGHIWIFTRGQGFFVFNTVDTTLTQNSGHGAFFNDAIRSADGHVYAADINGNLHCFTSAGHHINSLRLPGYVADKNPISIVQAGGHIWVGSNTSIYRYTPQTGSIALATPSAVEGEISGMITGIFGNILIGTDRGVWHYEIATGNVTALTSYGERTYDWLPDSRVTALTHDADNALLIVTPTGVSRVQHRTPEFHRVKIGLDRNGRNDHVSALCATPDGRAVWVGTESGLSLYDTATGAISRDALPDMSGMAVTSLTADGRHLWIGTHHQGLFRFDVSNGNLRKYIYDESIPYAVISNDINEVYRTSAGEVFVLTNWGLCKYSSEKDNFFTLAEIGSHIPFVTMQEDRQGRLWAATATDGLYLRERPDTAFQAGHGRSLGNRPVSILYLDSHGILWAVQGNKVYYFHEPSDDFLPLDVSMIRDYPVMFLQEDSDGNLWIGTFGGLIKVAPDRSQTYFAYQPGVDEASAVSGASCRTASGEILFGFSDGFWSFDPHAIKNTTRQVRAYVQSISFPYLDDSSEEVERLGLNSLLYTRGEITLPYSDNTFTLRLAASRYGDMPKVRFDYQLEGVDKVWIRDAGPEVTYTDLRPGTYTFRVRPSYGTDAQVQQLVIVVLPPWYLTTWAYIIYALLLLVAVIGASVLYRRRLSRHYQNRINELRIQKERETFESKMRFFVNLVHEIRTPLTLINLPLEQMAEMASGQKAFGTPEGEKARRHIGSMQRNVNYLLGITNQLLDFRKAEHDSEVHLNYRRCNVSVLLRDIVSRFDHPMASAGKEITLSLPDEDVYAVLDVDKADRVVMNIIGNAMKYSRHTVAVALGSPSDGKFTISVADDGPGIPHDERKHIFDTYYQIGNDNVAASLGTGLGLAYAKLIAKAHGGNIRVRNSEGGGAVFAITLPLGDESKVNPVNELIDRPEVTRDLAAGTGAGLSGAEAPESPNTDARVTVLIVDDNAELLSAMTESLSRWYRIITASDGEDALKVLAHNTDVDIIISDFMMPRMDGAELARRVKANPETSYIPFIILTAKTGPDARMEGIESGADVFVEKPFSIRQLRQQVENILRTRELFHSRIRSAGSHTADDTPVQQEPLLNRLDAEFLSSLNDSIRENICDEEFSIDVLAKQMNMSRSSFYRKIKAITGMTPVDYLKNFRLDYSARLLLDGVRVTEVAIQAGFTSSSYFAKCFKAKFGMIPKEYAANPPR